MVRQLFLDDEELLDLAGRFAVADNKVGIVDDPWDFETIACVSRLCV
jgi:hypothetical protein